MKKPHSAYFSLGLIRLFLKQANKYSEYMVTLYKHRMDDNCLKFWQLETVLFHRSCSSSAISQTHLTRSFTSDLWWSLCFTGCLGKSSYRWTGHYKRSKFKKSICSVDRDYNSIKSKTFPISFIVMKKAELKRIADELLFSQVTMW